MVQISEVESQSRRIVQTYDWGDVVWHVWGSHSPTWRSSAAGKPPIVLLHGGSGSWTHWLRNVRHIAEYRPVWALDLPGFGDSSLPAQVWDADDLVPYLAQILNTTFAAVPVDVMGFSFGGLTAGLLAAEQPECIRELILVGAPALGLFGKELPMRGMQPEMNEAAQREVHRHNLSTMMLAQPSRVTQEVIDLQLANVARDRMRRRRIARTDILAQVQSRWTCPVHGVWGAQDALYAGTMAQIPRVLTKLASLQIVPDAGHWVMFERPDAFHAAVDPLLRK